MLPIIAPVPREVLLQELTKDKLLRNSNFGNNEIYLIDNKTAPNVMLEIGRLREEAFRDAGGGTGKELDIDEFDICENPYEQLIVWDSKEFQILGGYRIFDCKNLEFDSNNEPKLATSHLFKFSEKFLSQYMPHTLELGRSFVQPRYQASKSSRQAIFTLDNLWDGLGAIITKRPHLKYFFGKITMYTHFNQQARDMILFFLKKYFPDPEKLLVPIEPLQLNTPEIDLEKIFESQDYKTEYKKLSQKVRELGENIPPLFSSYMSLSSTMKSFGTALNHDFGDVEETGILINIADIYETKRNRHINPKKH